MNIKSTILALSLCLITTSASASLPQTSSWHLCPKSSELIKNPKTLVWYTKSGWRSHSPSFANHIKKFLGAQWQGVNIGGIFCVYKGDGFNFNIKLYGPGLFRDPNRTSTSKDKANMWVKHKNGGYENCISDNQSACVFQAFEKKEPRDIYTIFDSHASEPKNSVPAF